MPDTERAPIATAGLNQVALWLNPSDAATLSEVLLQLEVAAARELFVLPAGYKRSDWIHAAYQLKARAVVATHEPDEAVRVRGEILRGAATHAPPPGRHRRDDVPVSTGR